ncbi:hypothetical protein [Malaciobacter marinus]|uniref:hypothetical protein n=1 Tax=Malaciobacter marinus TaxID=505249 RepID=UPI0009A85489|nr:hypothetical protein [Malaciobacter marinus]SKB26461.1 hypothetical protein SAMN06295997_102134 [Malaciobacter marinus]
MNILAINSNILSFISENSYESLLSSIDGLKSDEFEIKKIKEIDKIDPNNVFKSFQFKVIDKLRAKKSSWDVYYHQNISLVVHYLESLATHIKCLSDENKDIDHPLDIARDVLLMYIDFKQRYEYLINSNSYEAPAGITMHNHSMGTHIKLNALLYHGSGFSPRELVPLTVFEIRQLIETKIYHSFGLEFVYDENSDEFRLSIIPTKVFFEFLTRKDIKECITFVKKDFLTTLQSIYTWTNEYIHTGRFNYYWQIFYAIYLLKNLNMGMPPNEKGFNADSGVQIKKTKLEYIQNEFEKYINEGSQNKNLKCHFEKIQGVEIE